MVPVKCCWKEVSTISYILVTEDIVCFGLGMDNKEIHAKGFEIQQCLSWSVSSGVPKGIPWGCCNGHHMATYCLPVTPWCDAKDHKAEAQWASTVWEVFTVGRTHLPMLSLLPLFSAFLCGLQLEVTGEDIIILHATTTYFRVPSMGMDSIATR